MTRTENKIFKSLLIVSFLCVVYQIIRTLLAGANTLEYTFSSMRIFLEINILILIFSYYKKTPFYIVNLFKYFLIFNSIIILFAALGDIAFGTQITTYFRSFTGEPPEFLRFSGLVGHFQLPAFLFSLFLVFGQKYIDYRFILINILAGLLLSRSLFLFNILILLLNYPKVAIRTIITVITLVFMLDLSGLSEITTIIYKYLELRFFVFFGGIQADSSAKDTLSTYWLFNYYSYDLSKLMFGEHLERFSPRGGRDPYYTRWLVGGGLVILVLLETLKVKLAHLLTKGSSLNFVVGISLFTFSDLKGDMTLTMFVIPLILAFIFMGMMHRAKN